MAMFSRCNSGGLFMKIPCEWHLSFFCFVLALCWRLGCVSNLNWKPRMKHSHTDTQNTHSHTLSLTRASLFQFSVCLIYSVSLFANNLSSIPSLNILSISVCIISPYYTSPLLNSTGSLFHCASDRDMLDWFMEIIFLRIWCSSVPCINTDGTSDNFEISGNLQAKREFWK